MRLWSGVTLCVFIYGRAERLENDDAYEVEHMNFNETTC
jgi:hypothetical protein